MPQMSVATVLTVYGIETNTIKKRVEAYVRKVATVLTVYGIETHRCLSVSWSEPPWVATVLTVYGIETITLYLNKSKNDCCNSPYRLRY